MVTLGLLCVFLTVVLAIMIMMAIGAQGIAKDMRENAEQVEDEQEKQ
ncbi:MAG: hypothetical protein ACRD82_23920 [Blastocatellia bacterium]